MLLLFKLKLLALLSLIPSCYCARMDSFSVTLFFVIFIRTKVVKYKNNKKLHCRTTLFSHSFIKY